ncbi:MAG TPA: hypothetical protein PLQ82_09435, partial [Desulfobacteraceae bacterium]|nr:hypothetical protein [Desulfobacteraceae bacterium]
QPTSQKLVKGRKVSPPLAVFNAFQDNPLPVCLQRTGRLAALEFISMIVILCFSKIILYEHPVHVQF